MDIFTPKKDAKGVGVITVVSGGFVSSHESISPGFVKPLTDRGYTVFAVVHGSQPRYTIPEIVKDMNRAVRFIRYHAQEYRIDPDRLGISGASAGGHLSLMLGTAGDGGDPKIQSDPSRSRVQPGTGSRLLFPANRLLELRQGRRCKIHAMDVACSTAFRAAFIELPRTGQRDSRLWVHRSLTTQACSRKSPDRSRTVSQCQP